MAGKQMTDLEAVMYNVIGRCVEKSLQPAVDAIVKKLLDTRLEKLLEAQVGELLSTMDLAADPLKGSAPKAAAPKAKKTTTPVAPAPAPVAASTGKEMDIDDILKNCPDVMPGGDNADADVAALS